MEFFVPIKEAVNTGNDFMIRGVAINETTTRNGITYVASELESAAPTFRNKPILTDHSASVKDIVGRTTENVNFDPITKAINFEGRIMDNKIKEMINDGRITDVSIGASVNDIVEDKENGTVTAVGLEGLEISLVAVPGDPGANLANALQESFKLKEMQMNGEEVDVELNNEEEVNMEEAEKEKSEENTEETTEETTEEESKEESVAKESKTITNVNVDMSTVTESIKDLAKQVSELTKKVNEQDETPAPAEAEAKAEDEIPKAESVEDETTGEVGNEETEKPTEDEEGIVVDKAEVGPGLEIYRDYSKSSGKFNRLCRE